MVSKTPNGSSDKYITFRKLLYKRLSESGWCDQVRMMIRNEIKQSGNNKSVDDLAESILPKARSMVPTAVKREMLQKVKTHLLTEADYYDDISTSTK